MLFIILLLCIADKNQYKMSEKLEASKTAGKHFQINQLVGEWEGTGKVWFGPETLADESPVFGQMRSILDGRFVLHEYNGSFGGKPLEGMAIYGYHLELEKFQSIWLDSFHNGAAMMFSEGGRGDEKFAMLGGYSYVTPELEQKWGWRTEIEMTNTDQLIITAYNISPEGEETKATETIYHRK